MRRAVVVRLIAVVSGMLLGLSAPGIALAHGYSHHESSEHAHTAGEHDHTLADAANVDVVSLPTAQLSTDPRDHAHPDLSYATTARVSSLLITPSSSVLTVPARIVFIDRSSLFRALPDVPPGPPDAPPLQSRAPPLG